MNEAEATFLRVIGFFLSEIGSWNRVRSYLEEAASISILAPI